jgi:hypothetical protein
MSGISPSMKTAQPSAKEPVPKLWPSFEIWPSLSSEWRVPATSPPHYVPVLASALPSFASSASLLDFDGAVCFSPKNLALSFASIYTHFLLTENEVMPANYMDASFGPFFSPERIGSPAIISARVSFPGPIK